MLQDMGLKLKLTRGRIRLKERGLAGRIEKSEKIFKFSVKN